MFYQCPECEQIYKFHYQASACCPPNPTPVPDEYVVSCWRCKGDGCKACNDQGIMLVRLMRARDKLAMATIKKYL